MAWEKRGKSKYYTQTVRRGRRFVRRYVGGGSLARLAAQVDALLVAERRAAVQAAREERLRWRNAVEGLEELGRLMELLSRARLLVSGFRQHHRGEWRRRRDQPSKRWDGAVRAAAAHHWPL
jgi:hypothetical protein